jgi:hypothetical protein
MRSTLTTPIISKSLERLCLLLVFISVPAQAQADVEVTVRAAVFDAEGQLTALWHDRGLHVVSPPEGSSFVCNDALPQMQHILRTGKDRLLVAGDAGASLTLTGGCKWKKTTGTYAFDRVIGTARDPDDAQRVVIAFGDQGIVVESLDGGHTTIEVPLLAVGNVEFYALAGEGKHLLISGRSTLTGDRKIWHSHDAGRTFVEASLGEGEDQTPWLVSDTAAWVSEGADFVRLELDTGAVTSRVPCEESPLAVTREANGKIWLALGTAGLWRLEGLEKEEFVQERTELTSWVHWTQEELWIGGAATSWDQPVLWSRNSGASEWLARFHFSQETSFGSRCPTLLSQSCAPAVENWESDWNGGESQPPDLVVEDPRQASGCTIHTGTEASRFPLIILLLMTLGVACNRPRQF